MAESLNLGGRKIRGSSEVSQPGGGSPASPGSRSSRAGRKAGRRARTPAPPDTGPGLREPARAPTLPTRRLARRASASKIPEPSQQRPPRPLLPPLGSVRSGTSSSAATKRPRRVQGEGRRRGRPRPAPPPPPPPLGGGLS